ncbi:hypothetical protein Tco_1430949 [Tanacetum coccineum]
MAPMASSDSKVKTCSKHCPKNNETLKKQYDDLRTELNKSQSDLTNYKRGLTSVEERLLFFKKNKVIFCDKVDVLKRDVSIRDSEINVLRRLFSPPKIDLSNSGLEEFQEPKFEGYGPKTSKNVSEESSDAPLVKKLVSYDKSGKKTIFPTVAKIEFVKFKQQEKPVRKQVKQSYLDVVCCCYSRQVNTVRPKAVVNAVRMNRGNPETKLEDLVRLNSPEDKKLTRARKTWL